jgi:siroheme synthase
MKLIALITALALTMSIGVATASAATQYQGTVVSVNKAKRTFRLSDAQRGTIRIKVTRNTTFQRIAGFSALQAGMKRVEAAVKRSNGHWVALHVERSGGGGRHGGGADD